MKSTSLADGGVPNTLFFYAEALANQDSRNRIITSNGVEFRENGTHVTGASLLKRLFINKAARVFIFGCWQWRAVISVLLIILFSKAKVYYCPKGQLCDIEFRTMKKEKHLYYLMIERWLLTIAHKIVVNSELEKKSLIKSAKKISKDKLVVIPEGLYFGDKTPLPPSNKSKASFEFAVIGKYSVRKRLELALDLFLGLEEFLGKNCKLHVVGSPTRDYQQTWDALASYYAESESIIFHGSLVGQKKWDLLYSVDGLFFPSEFESYGLVVLEACLLGKKIVVSENVGALEYTKGSNIYRLRENSEKIDVAQIAAFFRTENAANVSTADHVKKHNLRVQKQIERVVSLA